jgi:hypothetical protein
MPKKFMVEISLKNHVLTLFQPRFYPHFDPLSAIMSFAKIFAKIFISQFPSVSRGKLATLKFRFALKLLQIALSITLLLLRV